MDYIGMLVHTYVLIDGGMIVMVTIMCMGAWSGVRQFVCV